MIIDSNLIGGVLCYLADMFLSPLRVLSRDIQNTLKRKNNLFSTRCPPMIRVLHRWPQNWSLLTEEPTMPGGPALVFFSRALVSLIGFFPVCRLEFAWGVCLWMGHFSWTLVNVVSMGRGHLKVIRGATRLMPLLGLTACWSNLCTDIM